MVEYDRGCCTFRTRCPRARWVAIVGDFNQWSTETHRMLPVGEHEWELTIRLRPGTYRFRYVASGGRWMTDYAAFGVTANGRGGWDSLVLVPSPINEPSMSRFPIP